MQLVFPVSTSTCCQMILKIISFRVSKPSQKSHICQKAMGWLVRFWRGWLWVYLPAEAKWPLLSWHSQPSSHQCSSSGRIPCLTLLIVCTVCSKYPELLKSWRNVAVGRGGFDPRHLECLVSHEKTRKASLPVPKPSVFCIKEGWQLEESMGQRLCRRWWKREQLSPLSPSLPLLSDIASRQPAQHGETKIAIDRSPPQTGPSAAELLQSGVLETYFKWQQSSNAMGRSCCVEFSRLGQGANKRTALYWQILSDIWGLCFPVLIFANTSRASGNAVIDEH